MVETGHGSVRALGDRCGSVRGQENHAEVPIGSLKMCIGNAIVWLGRPNVFSKKILCLL